MQRLVSQLLTLSKAYKSREEFTITHAFLNVRLNCRCMFAFNIGLSQTVIKLRKLRNRL